MGSCTVAAKELESTCRVEWLWKVILCLELQELSSGKGRGTCRMRKRKGIKKKSEYAFACARLSILSNVVRNYSATTAAESTAAESATTAVESTTGAASSTVSTAAESAASSLLAALLPQDAKDTAANATNKNTNFFIFFAFLNL